jgi:4-hydroxybenzoate polyprenyltransferase
VDGACLALFSHPSDVAKAILALPRGRAHVKAALADHSARAVASSPENPPLVAWLREEAARGRRLHLVTAADQRVAEAAAERFGIFETVLASGDGRNLKGSTKRDELCRRFPSGFSYVGDSVDDLPAFSAAESIILAGHDSNLTSKVERLAKPVERAFPREQPRLRDWLKLVRIHQWSKNLLMFVPFLLGGAITDLHGWIRVGVGFILMSLCASGTYILNDLSDLESDRAHSTKSSRPVASGRISSPVGLLASLVLIFASSAIAMRISAQFGGILLIYTALTLTYSLWLKKLAIVDVGVLAVSYALRLVMGSILAGTPLSGWLVVFALTFFLSLSLAKRQTEIVKASTSGQLAIAGRGYRPSDATLTLSLGIAAAMMALLEMVMFLVFQAFTQPNYVRPHLLWIAPFLTFFWIGRVWLFASRGELKDDPVVFAVKDPASIGLGVMLLLTVIAAVLKPL